MMNRADRPLSRKDCSNGVSRCEIVACENSNESSEQKKNGSSSRKNISISSSNSSLHMVKHCGCTHDVDCVTYEEHTRSMCRHALHQTKCSIMTAADSIKDNGFPTTSSILCKSHFSKSHGSHITTKNTTHLTNGMTHCPTFCPPLEERMNSCCHESKSVRALVTSSTYPTVSHHQHQQQHHTQQQQQQHPSNDGMVQWECCQKQNRNFNNEGRIDTRKRLASRRMSLLFPMWAFILLFSSLLWVDLVLAQSSTPSSAPGPIVTTLEPTSAPVSISTPQPTPTPTSTPSQAPTPAPSSAPTPAPSSAPTPAPSSAPSSAPTPAPSPEPTSMPSSQPSLDPTTAPSSQPSPEPTSLPSLAPAPAPSLPPSPAPTTLPSRFPSQPPTQSRSPSSSPTVMPSFLPSFSPVIQSTSAPSSLPTLSRSPSSLPTFKAPSSMPTADPTQIPSTLPTLSFVPTAFPSFMPSSAPITPTNQPSRSPSSLPSAPPTGSPRPTFNPTRSIQPSASPTVSPTNLPSMVPTISSAPTISFAPSLRPSLQPTEIPSTQPSRSRMPTSSPSSKPSISPRPSLPPTLHPSALPSRSPSNPPSAEPTSDLPFSTESDYQQRYTLLRELLDQTDQRTFEGLMESYVGLHGPRLDVKDKVDATCKIIRQTILSRRHLENQDNTTTTTTTLDKSLIERELEDDGGTTGGSNNIFVQIEFTMTWVSLHFDTQPFVNAFRDFINERNTVDVNGQQSQLISDMQSKGLPILEADVVFIQKRSAAPTESPTEAKPSYHPSSLPSYGPSLTPSFRSSQKPTIMDSLSPSTHPSLDHSMEPSLSPSDERGTFKPSSGKLVEDDGIDDALGSDDVLPGGGGGGGSSNTVIIAAAAGGVGVVLGILVLFVLRRRRLQKGGFAAAGSPPIDKGKRGDNKSRYKAGPGKTRGGPPAYNAEQLRASSDRFVEDVDAYLDESPFSNEGPDSQYLGGGMNNGHPDMIPPSESLVSNQSMISAGLSISSDSGPEADATHHLADEFDQYKDQNLEKMRTEVERTVPNFDGEMSQALTKALMDDDDLTRDMSELMWGGNGDSTEIEAGVLCEMNDWLKRKEGASMEERRLFMQETLNKMVASVRHGIIAPEEASRAIHGCAALLGLQLAEGIPETAVIVTGMRKLVERSDVVEAFQEFGEISEAAVSPNARGFGLVRFKSPKSVQRAMERFRTGEIVVQDVAVMIKVLKAETTLPSRNDVVPSGLPREVEMNQYPRGGGGLPVASVPARNPSRDSSRGSAMEANHAANLDTIGYPGDSLGRPGDPRNRRYMSQQQRGGGGGGPGSDTGSHTSARSRTSNRSYNNNNNRQNADNNGGGERRSRR